MLEIKELTKKYGDFTAVNRVNLSLEKGVYGILARKKCSDGKVARYMIR